MLLRTKTMLVLTRLPSRAFQLLLRDSRPTLQPLDITRLLGHTIYSLSSVRRHYASQNTHRPKPITTQDTMATKYLLTGGYVATMDDALGDFPGGAVLVVDGKIAAVGKAEDLEIPSDAEIIETTGGVVMPGMVDTHRHTCMSLMRGIGADQSLLQYLSNCFIRYLPATNAEDLRLAALVGALEAIDGGVTTILDPADSCRSHAHSEAALQGLEDAGIRAFFCFGMSDDHYDQAAQGTLGHEARLAHIDALHRANVAKKDKLVHVGLSLSHPGTVPFDKTETEIKFADQRGMLCCSHSAAIKSTNLCYGIMERADNGLMLPGHVYIHCTNLTDEELDLIAKTGGKVSIAPETEMMMGMGFPPFRACLDHGIDPSLSLDTSSAAAPELLGQLRLGLQFQRCLDNDASHQKRKMPVRLDLTVRDALKWVTRNGAAAVGLADQIGTLTPGKRADVIFISNERALTPSANPLGTAALYSSAADVDTVMVDGQIRKRHGQLVGHDRSAIRARTEEALKRINASLADLPPEMTVSEIRDFLAASERSTRANLAKAYTSKETRGDWLRKN